MKKIFLFLVPLSILIAASSCSMEKRIYRKGWYTNSSAGIHRNLPDPASEATIKEEKNSGDTAVVQTSISPAKKTGNDSIITADQPVSVAKAHPYKDQMDQLKKKYTQKINDPKRMTYAQARKSMAEKGCQPDPMAMASYYFSVAAIISCWFGIGLLFLVVALVLSIFATNAAAKTSCADENLAIIAAGKRLCYLALIWSLIVAVIALLITLAILGIAANSTGI